MSRKVSLIVHGSLVEREMPDACSEVLPGVIWGDPWTLFTPAYWLAQAWMSEIDTRPSGRYSVKHGLIGELGFCLLGGFGITAELATAAYDRCWQAGLFLRYETRPEAWVAELSEPLQVGSRKIRYRYPNQKSRFLAAAMEYVQHNELRTDSGMALREQLLNINGVDYKIASWLQETLLIAMKLRSWIFICSAPGACAVYSLQDIGSSVITKRWRRCTCSFLKSCRFDLPRWIA